MVCSVLSEWRASWMQTNSLWFIARTNGCPILAFYRHAYELGAVACTKAIPYFKSGIDWIVCRLYRFSGSYLGMENWRVFLWIFLIWFHRRGPVPESDLQESFPAKPKFTRSKSISMNTNIASHAYPNPNMIKWFEKKNCNDFATNRNIWIEGVPLGHLSVTVITNHSRLNTSVHHDNNWAMRFSI